ncbi:SGNH/GDSL hydrolase family protein [Pseudobacter ginsenosidimutans]|nr:SGNH/GDSL hydrolase family protein [Pseudobacter ginsenosidimutans]QEC42329.1 hypothetical protein FSB84_11745 [Pseudobacter ginsenosidimutans]
MSKGRKILHRIFYGCFLLGITFLAMEIILRIYNPFGFRLKGDQIILPVNTKLTIQNSINPKLDSVIVNTRNELGFRGESKPADFNSRLSIITVGGSTTECHFNNDDKTWPALLEHKLDDSFQHVWLNNAGLDGHSTFGHQVLLQDYLVKIKPKVILFLTGVNDVESDRPSFHDQQNKRGAFSDLKHYLVNNSEVLSLLVNLARGWKAQQTHNTSGVNIDPRQLPVSHMTDAESAAQLKLQQQFLPGYRERVRELMDTCLKYQIKPVFITQPLLYGEGIDSVTQVNLATIRHKNVSGKCSWQVLELYNDELRKLGAERNILVIDLAARMPKNSLYFYDESHFTNAGTEKVASIVNESLAPWLANNFPSFHQ